jgi:hypothetical protein
VLLRLGIHFLTRSFSTTSRSHESISPSSFREISMNCSYYDTMSIVDKTREALPFRQRIYMTTVTINRRKCSSIQLEWSESGPYFLPPQGSKAEFLSSHMLSLDADNLCTGPAGTFLLSNHTFPTQNMPSNDSHLPCYLSIGSPSAVSSPTQSGE